MFFCLGNRQELFILYAVGHDNGKFFCRCDMFPGFIRGIQSVWRNKMSLCTAKRYGFFIHQPRKHGNEDFALLGCDILQKRSVKSGRKRNKGEVFSGQYVIRIGINAGLNLINIVTGSIFCNNNCRIIVGF